MGGKDGSQFGSVPKEICPLTRIGTEEVSLFCLKQLGNQPLILSRTWLERLCICAAAPELTAMVSLSTPTAEGWESCQLPINIVTKLKNKASILFYFLVIWPSETSTYSLRVFRKSFLR